MRSWTEVIWFLGTVYQAPVLLKMALLAPSTTLDSYTLPRFCTHPSHAHSACATASLRTHTCSQTGCNIFRVKTTRPKSLPKTAPPPPSLPPSRTNELCPSPRLGPSDSRGGRIRRSRPRPRFHRVDGQRTTSLTAVTLRPAPRRPVTRYPLVRSSRPCARQRASARAGHSTGTRRTIHPFPEPRPVPTY